MPARVLIADDNYGYRNFLKGLVQSQQDLSVVGCAADAREARELTTSLEPDVLVLSMGLPPEGGLEVCRWVKAAAPRVRVVMTCEASGTAYETAARNALADSFIDKGAEVSKILDAVRIRSSAATS